MSNLVNRLLDWVTNNYQIKFVVPGTHYCGPQYDSEELINRGVAPLSPVDALCQEHDKAYIASSDLNHRQKADQKLINSLKHLLTTNSLSTYQKLTAKIILALMSGKRFVGGSPRSTARIQTGSFPPLSILLPLLASGLTAINEARALIRGKGGSQGVKVGKGRRQSTMVGGDRRRAKSVISKKKKRRTTSRSTLKMRQF